MPILLVSIIALVVLLCIPATRALIVVFFINYFPAATTMIFFIAAVVLLPTAVIWSIYGLPTLIVLLLLATFSIWSSVARWLTTTILIVGLLAAFFYPPVKNFVVNTYPSSVEWMGDNKEYTNIKIKESSLSMKNAIRDSEVTIGTFGRIKEDGIAYDDFGAEIPGLIRKNQPVKSMGKIKSQDKTGNEGMIQVMLPKHGNFIGGDIVWVTIRNVTWEKQVIEKEGTPPPPAPSQQPPVSTPNSQRLNGQMADADLSIEGNYYRGKITLTGDLFAFNGGGLSLAGSRDKNCVWTGSWNKNREPPKSFTLRFTKTNHFSGEVYTENGKVEFSLAVIPSTIVSAR